jgi:hypothetical protein
LPSQFTLAGYLEAEVYVLDPVKGYAVFYLRIGREFKNEGTKIIDEHIKIGVGYFGGCFGMDYFQAYGVKVVDVFFAVKHPDVIAVEFQGLLDKVYFFVKRKGRKVFHIGFDIVVPGVFGVFKILKNRIGDGDVLVGIEFGEMPAIDGYQVVEKKIKGNIRRNKKIVFYAYPAVMKGCFNIVLIGFAHFALVFGDGRRVVLPEKILGGFDKIIKGNILDYVVNAGIVDNR